MKRKTKKKSTKEVHSRVVNTINLTGLSKELRNIVLNTIAIKDKSIKDIIIPRVDVCMLHIDTTYKEVIRVFNKFQNSRIPIYKDGIDDIVGILYVKDLVGIDAKNFSLKKLLHKPYFVPISISPMKLLHKFLEKRVHISIIVDEYGGFCGIVTMEDILEEILGEINDEFDNPEEFLIKESENGFSVDARMPIEDFNNVSKMPSIQTDVADTIGGFLFSHLGRLPKRGETIEYKNYIFTIVGKRGNIISSIRIERKNNKEEKKEEK